MSALWVPGRLKIQLEVSIPTEQVELQIVHSDSAEPWQKQPAFNGPAEITVPDDCRKLFLYLIHDSGEQIAQLQLSSLYESKGDVDPGLSLSSQAEMDLGRGETERVEFKPFISPNNSKETEVVETVIAFANTNGGRIYFGVRDRDGVPLGNAALREAFKNESRQGGAEGALKAQTDRARWLVSNKVVPIPRFTVTELAVFGEPVVAMIVHAGAEPPYHTREHQMFVRRGANNYQATPEELRVLMVPNLVNAL